MVRMSAGTLKRAVSGTPEITRPSTYNYNNYATVGDLFNRAISSQWTKCNQPSREEQSILEANIAVRNTLIATT
jgi:hypothetical protein